MSSDNTNSIVSSLANTSELPPSQVRTPGVSRQEFRRKQREAASGGSGGVTRTGLRKEPIPTIKLVKCPNCEKDRLGKYLSDDGQPFPVSSEKVDIRGTERFLDVCGPCAMRFREEDTRFVMSNLKKIQEAMRARKIGTSDKDFSIDL